MIEQLVKDAIDETRALVAAIPYHQPPFEVSKVQPPIDVYWNGKENPVLGWNGKSWWRGHFFRLKNGELTFVRHPGNYGCKGVTHWLPMPEAPTYVLHP